LDQHFVGSSRQRIADPSGYMLLVTGSERSEALGARGGEAPRGFAGVGPREANK